MSVRTGSLTIGLIAALVALVWLQLGTGPGGAIAGVGRGVGATFGFAEPLEGAQQTIVELRLWRALTAVFVGGALSLSGMLLQGLFRNALAAPSVIGVTAGASLGSAIAILALGGYLVTWSASLEGFAAPLVLSGSAFAGALVTAGLVTGIASIGGRVSVPTLLLAGIAVTTSVAGVLGAIQSEIVGNYEISRALLAFTFGSLDDRQGYHVAIAASGLGLSLLVVPFIATELDLLAGGEDDARALGVDVRLTKFLVLGASVLAASCAVAAAGQIAFLGLIAPHLVRLAAGGTHRAQLPLAALGGAVFLLATDWGQRVWFADRGLQPGVVMSLLGGPFFLSLLIMNRRRAVAW